MLEAEIKAFIDRSNAFYPPNSATLPFAEQRRLYDRYAASFARPLPPGVVTRDAVLAMADRSIGLRLYKRVDGTGSGGAGQGVVLYFHGGGYVLGSLDSHDLVTAQLAATTPAAVIAVDYRLAPEHTAPAAFQDCLAVAEACLARRLPFETDLLPAGPIILAGDSAGGGLAATTALALRDRAIQRAADQGIAGPGIAGLLMIYPGLAYDTELPAAVTEAEAPMLTLADIRAYRRLYLGGKTPDAYEYPLLATRFDGLPATLAIAAEHDPLRDDSRVFVDRLRAAGGTARYIVGEGLVHGCLRALGSSPGVDLIYRHMAEFIIDQTAGSRRS
ncbi:MAG TPA: alpha/beta hydrolase [Stellaceae bacterium]|nr:alpha/beta hydrolase [Stellaceae bacterium]